MQQDRALHGEAVWLSFPTDLMDSSFQQKGEERGKINVAMWVQHI